MTNYINSGIRELDHRVLSTRVTLHTSHALHHPIQDQNKAQNF